MLLKVKANLSGMLVRQACSGIYILLILSSLQIVQAKLSFNVNTTSSFLKPITIFLYSAKFNLARVFLVYLSAWVRA